MSHLCFAMRGTQYKMSLPSLIGQKPFLTILSIMTHFCTLRVSAHGCVHLLNYTPYLTPSHCFWHVLREFYYFYTLYLQSLQTCCLNFAHYPKHSMLLQHPLSFSQKTSVVLIQMDQNQVRIQFSFRMQQCFIFRLLDYVQHV